MSLEPPWRWPLFTLLLRSGQGRGAKQGLASPCPSSILPASARKPRRSQLTSEQWWQVLSPRLLAKWVLGSQPRVQSCLGTLCLSSLSKCCFLEAHIWLEGADGNSAGNASKASTKAGGGSQIHYPGQTRGLSCKADKKIVYQSHLRSLPGGMCISLERGLA